jgi:hypothetical protein
MPLLLGVSVIKYLVVFIHKFKVKRRIFYINLVCYIVYSATIVIIDYRAEIGKK